MSGKASRDATGAHMLAATGRRIHAGDNRRSRRRAHRSRAGGLRPAAPPRSKADRHWVFVRAHRHSSQSAARCPQTKSTENVFNTAHGALLGNECVRREGLTGKSWPLPSAQILSITKVMPPAECMAASADWRSASRLRRVAAKAHGQWHSRY